MLPRTMASCWEAGKGRGAAGKSSGGEAGGSPLHRGGWSSLAPAVIASNSGASRGNRLHRHDCAPEQVLNVYLSENSGETRGRESNLQLIVMLPWERLCVFALCSNIHTFKQGITWTPFFCFLSFFFFFSLFRRAVSIALSKCH